MTVLPEVSLEAVQVELPAAAQYAAAAGLGFDDSLLAQDDLSFFVTFHNLDGERFVAEINCQDYPMYPPFIEFIGETRTKRSTRDLYPSCFHGMPCVCTRYSRKAYSERGGPHGDWRLVDWQLPTSNGIAVDSLAMIVSDLHSKIAGSRGRLG